MAFILSGIQSVDDRVTKITNTDPYTYRQGKGNLADMEIVGASVEWNQLVENGNFADISGWSTLDASLSVTNGIASISSELTSSFTCIYRSVKLLNNHKYILLFSGKSGGSGTTNYQNKVVIRTNSVVYESPRITGNVFNYYSLVFSASSTVESDNYRRVYAYCDNSGNALEIKNLMTIDLTLLFGSTIADAIYAMEQATEGAGVAFFRKYFPKDYYAYDAGSIQSVSVGSRKVTGFNLWDGTYESGKGVRASDGELQNSGDKYATGYIPVCPEVQYYVKNIISNSSTYGYAFYDENKTFIRGENYSVSSQSVLGNITVPSGAKYVRITIISGVQDINTFCINISNTAKNGTYEPYTSTAYLFDSTKELRGLFSLVGGELKANGDVYTTDGSITRKWWIVDLGTITYTYNVGSACSYFRGTIPSPTRNGGAMLLAGYECIGYTGGSTTIGSSTRDKQYCGTSGADILIRNDSYTNAATFKTAMSGVYLIYELATPITESAQLYQNPQRAYIDGTEEFMDGATRDVMIPVGNTTVYSINAVLPDAENYADGVGAQKVGWAEQGVLGAKNFLNINNIITVTNANIQYNGWINTSTDSLAFRFRFTAKDINNQTIGDNLVNKYIMANGHYEYAVTVPNGTYALLHIHSGTTKNFGLRFAASSIIPGDYILSFDVYGYDTSTVGGVDIRDIMLRPVSCMDKTFQPYSKTNRQLTTDKAEVSAIGTDESGRTTASKAYAVGDHFYKDGKFCTVISAITSWATLTKNTNYREDSEGMSGYVNNYRAKKLTATVSSSSLSFTDSLISDSNTVIDGPYIADVLIGVTAASISSNTVTYTLDGTGANNKSAYIWLRY